MRKHIILLVLWLALIIVYTHNYGEKIGIPSLFLCPEYMNKVNGLSFFIAGWGFGGFFIVWNVTVYLLHSTRFQFLSYVKQPFTHFIINNLILPLSVLLIFFYNSFQFQYNVELIPFFSVIWHLTSFVLGIFFVVFFTWLYFLFFHTRLKVDAPVFGELFQYIDDNNEVEPHWTEIRHYFNPYFKIKKVRKFLGEAPMLDDIFRKNSINSIIILVLGLLAILLLNFFVDFPFLQIPACASSYLVFAVICSFIGVFGYFLKKWSTFFLVLIVLLINFLSSYVNLSQQHALFGLDYSIESSTDVATLYDKTNTEHQEKDKKIQLEILNNFKEKKKEEKPKIVLICSSGGGLSSAYWTLLNLQKIDSATQGTLMENNIMMTGSSGGMIGLSYYRSLFLDDLKNKCMSRIESFPREEITKDILNPVMFSLFVNDFFNLKNTVEINGREYTKDRGYTWEKKLNENTKYLMDHPIGFYAKDEYQGNIPQLVFTPKSINDDRKFIISCFPMTILCRPMHTKEEEKMYKPDGIDVQTIFKDNSPSDILLTSAMRATSTFPFVMPNITLPSSNQNQIMDSGLRDNYGLASLMQYMHVMKDWINENTSGVILIQFRNFKNKDDVKSYKGNSLLSKFDLPVGHLTSNIDLTPDYVDDYFLSFSKDWLKVPLQYESLEYIPQKEHQKAGMSFHLSKSEKIDIQKSLDIPSNQKTRESIIKSLNY